MKYENVKYVIIILLISNLIWINAFGDRKTKLIGDINNEELIQEIKESPYLTIDTSFNNAIVYTRDLTMFEKTRDFILCNMLMILFSICIIKLDERWKNGN